ncbi:MULTISPECIES: M20 family metallopeptidase [Alicyclobacillus]|uniref:Amidohydrolase n=1 Tax=Alicyclobacillus tolerans TaxID=90970 RepID=A0ABT9LUM0_9BACL|nr:MULTISPECIES: M20 family metallopeptidase [Alicyclobacillus]MDP9727960.1 amidohydrolase [Alicyclobacillus tengchongensis]
MTELSDVDLQRELVAVRRALHRHPETGLEEYATTQTIENFLKEHGIEIISGRMSTGTFAYVKGKRPGPCVAIRADIDALPILEATGLPYASEIEGKMHACGHDFHTAAVIGSALLAKERAESDESFAGSLLFVFQPAEELGLGAKLVLDSGVLKEHQVKCMIGEHNNPLLESGKIGVRVGPLMGSVDEFTLTIHGVGGHAAIPNLTVDPIVIGAHLVTALQTLVSRGVSPLASGVVTVGKFQAGTARNVIPDIAVLEGTVRSLDENVRRFLEERIWQVSETICKAFGGSVDIEFERQLPVTTNHSEVAEWVRLAAIQVVGEENVVEAEQTLGGEDFSIYSQVMPACFFWVGTGKGDGSSRGWHHPQFDVDENCLLMTSRVLLQSGYLALEYYAQQEMTVNIGS